MIKTLFLPTGSLSAPQYWRACLVLYFVHWTVFAGALFGFGQSGLGGATFLLVTSLALIYPYYCVYAKRLHNIGVSRIFFIPIVLSYYLLLLALGSAGQKFIAHDVMAVYSAPFLVFAMTSLATLVVDIFVGILKRPSALILQH